MSQKIFPVTIFVLECRIVFLNPLLIVMLSIWAPFIDFTEFFHVSNYPGCSSKQPLCQDVIKDFFFSESKESVLILPKIKKDQMIGNKIFMSNTMTFIFKNDRKILRNTIDKRK